MKIQEIKAAAEAERKAKEEAFKPISVDGVEVPASPLDGLELPDFTGIPNDILFCIADVAYRTAGIRTSRLVQSDPCKEIGGLVSYLLDTSVKNTHQREQWLVIYVHAINQLVCLYRTAPSAFALLDAVRALRAESAEDVAYRLLKEAKGSVSAAQAAAIKEGRDIPKWVFNKALERLTAEIFARMA